MNYTQDFRHKIIALTLSPVWFVHYDGIIQPAFFENDAEITLVKSILSFYAKYNRPPQLDEIETFISQLELKPSRIQETLELARSIYNRYDKWDLSYARDEVVKFAQMQGLKIAMLEAIDKIEEGETDGIDRAISQALQIGVTNKSLRLKRDVDIWLTQLSEVDRITTGLYHVDRMLNGGLARKEVGVIIAPPNYGKSMTLINIGFGACSSDIGYNVGHISFEIPKETLSKRYGARITHGWFNKDDSIAAYRDKFNKMSSRTVVTDVDMRDEPPSTISSDDIRRYLDKSSRDGFEIDLLLVDYADLMKLPKGDNSFERHGENYSRLIQIAKDYNIALWTASQSHRASLRKLTIDLDDIAESFQKAARADVVLTWCQTPEEEDDHEMRFFCAKNRDGQKHWYVRCKITDSAHAITSQDIVWGGELVRAETDKRKANRA